MNEKSIILTGFMGTGKTSVGRMLSEKLQVPVLDSDRMLAEQENMTVSEIFARYGEAYFRDAETALLRTLQRREDCFILSTGGGLPLREENRPLLRKLGAVVYLQSSLDTLEIRLARDTSRPLLRGDGPLRGRIARILEEREPKYLDAADICIVNDGKSVSQTADEIIEAWRKWMGPLTGET